MNANTLETNRTTISLSKETYEKLSRLGFTGESFDELINRLIAQVLEANKKDSEEGQED